MSNISLLDRVLGWYRSADPGKKAAALELFPEEKLESEMDAYLKRKKKQDILDREQTLQEKLERCRKLFPIGTLVWNDEYSDHCPNIIISEPYIGESDSYHMPYSINSNLPNTTILAKTMRIFHGNEIDEKYSPSIIGLEKCLDNMIAREPGDSFYRNHIINLKDFYKEEFDKRSKEIERCEKLIADYQKQIDSINESLRHTREYNPKNLNAEFIKNVVDKYKIENI